MNNEDPTQPIDVSDGSESRFNPIRKQQPGDKQASEIEFESWHEPPIVENMPPATTPLPNASLQKSKKQTGVWVGMAFLILLVFFTPFRISTLVLGVDARPNQDWIGRTDTMILTTIPPVIPKLSMLSFPRDLWVEIPNHYENRINTAHYFAELETPGTGMQAAKEVVELNSGLKVNYVVRIRLSGFKDIVDAMGGVTVDLPEDMSGLKAGKNHLDGTQALAFVRDRTGSDDFFRQQRGHLFITAAVKQMLNPLSWQRLPAILAALTQAVQTNLPVWLWPRVGCSLLFSGVNGFETYTFDRNTVTPWVTDEGAQVLVPNWELMQPVIKDFLN